MTAIYTAIHTAAAAVPAAEIVSVTNTIVHTISFVAKDFGSSYYGHSAVATKKAITTSITTITDTIALNQAMHKRGVCVPIDWVLTFCAALPKFFKATDSLLLTPRDAADKIFPVVFYFIAETIRAIPVLSAPAVSDALESALLNVGKAIKMMPARTKFLVGKEYGVYARLIACDVAKGFAATSREAEPTIPIWRCGCKSLKYVDLPYEDDFRRHCRRG